MKNVVLLALTLFSAFTAVAQDFTVDQRNIITEKLSPFPNKTEVSIACIKNGEVKYHGFLIKNGKLEPIDNSKSMYEIGSITKVFTSTILANLVGEGSLSLSDPIQKYIADPLHVDQEITLLQLANHTAGLPKMPTNFNYFVANMANPYKDYGEAELMEYMSHDLELDNTPGTHYEYSNLGVGLLGYIMSKQTVTSYADLLDKYAFTKYNMESSTIDRKDLKNLLVKGRDYNGNVTSNWDLNALSAAGAIISNVEDLARFAQAQFNEKDEALALTRKPTFKVNSKMEMGLGWHLLTTKSGEEWIWHNGGTGGYTSSMAIDTGKENAVIILTNISAFHKDHAQIDALCFALMNELKM